MAESIVLRIKRVPSYDVHGPDGKCIGRFRVDGEWEGMTKLVSEVDGKILVIEGHLGSALALFDASEADHLLVKGSPDLVLQLKTQAVPPNGHLQNIMETNNGSQTDKRES